MAFSARIPVKTLVRNYDIGLVEEVCVDMDIASAAVQMSSQQVSSQYAVAVMKNNMDATKEIANQLISQLAELDVGPSPHKVDLSL